MSKTIHIHLHKKTADRRVGDTQSFPAGSMVRENRVGAKPAKVLEQVGTTLYLEGGGRLHVSKAVAVKTGDAEFNKLSAAAQARSAIKNARAFLEAASNRPSSKKHYESAISLYEKAIAAAKLGDESQWRDLLNKGHAATMSAHRIRDARTGAQIRAEIEKLTAESNRTRNEGYLADLMSEIKKLRRELANTKDATRAYLRTDPTQYAMIIDGKVAETYPRTAEGKRRAEMEIAEENLRTKDSSTPAQIEKEIANQERMIRILEKSGKSDNAGPLRRRLQFLQEEPAKAKVRAEVGDASLQEHVRARELSNQAGEASKLAGAKGSRANHSAAATKHAIAKSAWAAIASASTGQEKTNAENRVALHEREASAHSRNAMS